MTDMLSMLEADLVKRLEKGFGMKVRGVEPMPTVSGPALLAQFSNDAPCFYVAPMNGLISGDKSAHRWAVLAMTKHANSPQAARTGDGQVIGLYQMVSGVISLATWGQMPGWLVDTYDFVQDEAFAEAGLQVALLQLTVATDIDAPPADVLGADPLPDFLGLSAYVDVPPFASDADRQAWLAGQPGSTSPDIAGNFSLEES